MTVASIMDTVVVVSICDPTLQNQSQVARTGNSDKVLRLLTTFSWLRGRKNEVITPNIRRDIPF